MTIEIAVLISGVSFAFGIYQGVCNLKRNKTTDDKKEATQMTTVIVKLESIGTGVSEIKSDMRNIKEDIVDLRERMIIVEQSVKSAHHRIDSIECIFREICASVPKERSAIPLETERSSAN